MWGDTERGQYVIETHTYDATSICMLALQMFQMFMQWLRWCFRRKILDNDLLLSDEELTTIQL